MNRLKRLPITYSGALHEVKLINFSVALDEVLPHVPKGLKVRDFDGRAIISMVNVSLKNMRPKGLPGWACFSYQHLAFRLLVDDSDCNNGTCKGIYFLQSFSNKPWIVWSGSLLTHYRLGHAQIENDPQFRLQQGDHYLVYRLKESTSPENGKLKAIIQPLDRAYALDGNKLLRTRIQRECWPIEPVTCEGFDTNFFRTAQFLGAFRVREVIDYEWQAPTVCQVIA